MSQTFGARGWTVAVMLACACLHACGDDALGTDAGAGGSGAEDGGGVFAPDVDSGVGDAGGSDAGADSGADAGTGDAGGIDAGGGAPDGAACARGAECASGSCVDGVCCASACDDVCERCNADGRCEKPADDPACGTIDCDVLDDTCRDYHDLDANRCAARGKCKVSSVGACDDFTDALAGTVCSDPYCNGANAIAVDECDGAGACDADPAPVECGGYPCNPAGCPTSCVAATDCVHGVCDRRDSTCPATVTEADCASSAGALVTAIAACAASPTCYVRVKGTCDPVVIQDKDVYLASDGTGAVHDAAGGTAVEAYEAPGGAETKLALDGLTITNNGIGGSGGGVVCWALAGEVAQLWTFDTMISQAGPGLQAVRCDVVGQGDTIENAFEPVQMQYSTSSFADCTIGGGSDEGIGARDTTLSLTDCTVSNNAGQGLLANNNCVVNITRSTFDSNDNSQVQASNNTTITLIDSTIANGSTTGVYVLSGSTVTLQGTVVEGQTERGVQAFSGSVIFDASTVRSNMTEGVQASGGSTVTATSSTFADNGARGIFATDSHVTLINNFVVGNTSDGVRVSSANAITKVFRHNTVVGNGTGMQCLGVEGVVTIERSLFSNAPNTEMVGCTVDATSDVPGTADACADGLMAPIFVNAGAGDYHLGALSTCIDAVVCDGTTTDDFDGDARPSDSMCDVGADEAP